MTRSDVEGRALALTAGGMQAWPRSACLVLVLAMAAAVGGCRHGAGRGDEKKPSAKSEPLTGAFEFVNRSGQDVCGLEIFVSDYTNRGFVRHSQRIPTGSSARLTLGGLPSRHISVVACDGKGFLVSQNDVSIRAPRLVLWPRRSRAKKVAGEQVLLPKWARTFDKLLEEWGGELRDRPAFAKNALAEFVEEKGSSSTRLGKPVMAIVASGISRMNTVLVFIGYQHANGHCRVQPHLFGEGRGNRAGYIRKVSSTVGMGTCAFFEYLKTKPGVVTR